MALFGITIIGMSRMANASASVISYATYLITLVAQASFALSALPQDYHVSTQHQKDVIVMRFIEPLPRSQCSKPAFLKNLEFEDVPQKIREVTKDLHLPAVSKSSSLFRVPSFVILTGVTQLRCLLFVWIESSSPTTFVDDSIDLRPFFMLKRLVSRGCVYPIGRRCRTLAHIS
jgi:hypothetical protein